MRPLSVHLVSGPAQRGETFMPRLKLAAEKIGVFAQALNPAWAVSERHLISAFLLAEQAFAENSNTGKTLETETLLKAAATTQIQEALARAGIVSAKKFILLTDADSGQLAALLAEIGAAEFRDAGYSPDVKFITDTLGFSTRQLANYPLEELVLEAVAVSGKSSD